MKRIIPVILIFVMLFPTIVHAAPEVDVTVPGGPTFWVHDVKRNKSVTLRIEGMPQGKKYNVFLGFIGSNFGQGMYVGDIDDFQGDKFYATFAIPSRLINQKLLAVMVKDANDQSNYSYNIFANLDDWNSQKPYSLNPVAHSSAQSNGTSVEIFSGPTFAMHDVDAHKTFAISVTGWEGDTPYYVKVGTNDENFDGSIVGQISTLENYTFRKSFEIPSWLWYEPEIKVVLEGQFTGNSGSTAFTNVEDWEAIRPYGAYTTFWINAEIAAKKQAGKTPFTSIVDVVKDTEVTLQAFNFPADTDFYVTMGKIGTEGLGGYVVGSQLSEEGGSFYGTYPIPEALKGELQIAIRFQSKTSGHFAYNFFSNVDGYNFANSNVNIAGTGDWILPVGTYPSTSINANELNTSVTVNGYNFTKNDTYYVFMGAIGTQGSGGVFVGTIDVGNLGTFTQTFTIPSSLANYLQIAIRFESQNTNYYSYNFWDNK